jgi:hypothetical protein
VAFVRHKSHLCAHFRLDDPQVGIAKLDLDLDCALLAVGLRINLCYEGGERLVRVGVPEKSAGAFGMLSAAFRLGFVLGPALGGVCSVRLVHVCHVG